MIKKIGINTLLYAVGPQIPKILGFFMLPILTSHLTSTDYGMAGIIYAYTGLLGGIGDLGLHVRLANIYFKSPARWMNPWRQLFGFLSLWAVLFAVLQSVLLMLVLPAGMGTNRYVIIGLLAVSSIVFTTTINFCYRIFQFSEKAGYITNISIVVGVSTLVLNYLTIVQFKLGYLGWFISTFIGSGIQFVFCATHLFGKLKLFPELNLRKRYIKSTLRVTLPLVPHNYASYILDSSDRFLLDRMKVSITEIGRYNFAYMFAGYLDFFVSSLGIAISPTMYKIYYSKAEDRLVQLRTLMIACQLLFFFLVFNGGIWLKEFLHVFIRNSELKLVYPLGIIVLVGYTYKPLYWYVNAILTYNNKTASLWKITFSAALINIILNLLLIPHFSIYAAAWSTLASFLFLAFLGFSLRDFKEYNTLRFNLVVWLLGFGALLGVCLLFMDSPVITKLVVTLAGDALFGWGFYIYYRKLKIFSF